MASKAPQATVVSQTKSAKYKLVRRRIGTAAPTPAQTAATRTARRAALIRAANQRRAIQLQRQRITQFYAALRRQRRQQLNFIKQQEISYALRATRQQSLQMSTGARARKSAMRRAFRQYGVTSFARGKLTYASRSASAAARLTLTTQQALAATKTKNSSAAARAAQKAKAAGNKKRAGTKKKAKYVYVLTRVGSTARGQALQKAARAKAKQRASQAKKGKKAVKSTVKPKASCIMGENALALESRWVVAGNDAGTDNCLAVAIANHLLYTTGIRLSDDQVGILAKTGETIDQVISVMQCGLFSDVKPYLLIRGVNAPGMVCVFETPEGVHAVLRLPHGRVVSWGQELYPENRHTWFFKEAWCIEWEVAGRGQYRSG